MARLTVVKKAGSIPFEYFNDGVLITKTKETFFLSALSEYIQYYDEFDTNWIHEKSIPDPVEAPTSYTGRDGLQYTGQFPAIFYERQATGALDFMGGPAYEFVQISWEIAQIIPDNEVYVFSIMGNITLESWKNQYRFIGTPDASSGEITGLKESVTGFFVPLSKLSIVLGLTGEPNTNATPLEIADCCYLVKVLFEIRKDKTITISASGET